MAGAEWGWTMLSLSVLLNNLCTSLCSSLLVYPSALPSTMGSRTLQGCSEGKGVCESCTCSFGHYHLGFAASAIAFHGVGGYRDGIGSLRLQVCDDHLLRAGVAISDATWAAHPPPHARDKPGGRKARSAGRDVHLSSCHRPQHVACPC